MQNNTISSHMCVAKVLKMYESACNQIQTTASCLQRAGCNQGEW